MEHKRQTFNRLAGIAAAAATLLLAPAAAVTSEEGQPPAYVSGELLVTFTKRASRAVERARRQQTLPFIELNALEPLFLRYGVVAVEPLFPTAQNLEALKAKYPQRSRRAPAGAKAPDLSRTYRLKLAGPNSILLAARDFAANRFVEAAQPNYLMTTQTPGGLP